jgi:hypothetical protein
MNTNPGETIVDEADFLRQHTTARENAMITTIVAIVAALVTAELVRDCQRFAERHDARKHAND